MSDQTSDGGSAGNGENDTSPMPQTTNPTTSPTQEGVTRKDCDHDSAEDHNDSSNLSKEVHWIQHATFWSQIGLGLIGLCALFIYYDQLKQMTVATLATQAAAKAATDSAEVARGALDINREIISGTEGAYLPVPPRLDLDRNQVIITFSDVGKVPAKSLTANIEVSKQTLPDYKLIGRAQTFTVEAAEVHPGGIPTKRRIVFNGFTKADWDRVTQGQETITVKGTIRYDNGFGVAVSDSFCNSQLYLRFPDGHTSGGGWTSCEEVPETVESTTPYDQRKPW